MMEKKKGKSASMQVHRLVHAEDIIREYCQKNHLDVESVLSGFHTGVVAVITALIGRKSVQIPGMGVFRWKLWKPRLGYNRYREETVLIPSSWRIKFVPDEPLSPMDAEAEETPASGSPSA